MIYIRKFNEVEAIQWNGSNKQEIIDFVNSCITSFDCDVIDGLPNGTFFAKNERNELSTWEKSVFLSTFNKEGEN